MIVFVFQLSLCVPFGNLYLVVFPVVYLLLSLSLGLHRLFFLLRHLIFIKMGQFRPLFVCFRPFLINNINWKKLRCYGWDSNPWPQKVGADKTMQHPYNISVLLLLPLCDVSVPSIAFVPTLSFYTFFVTTYYLYVLILYLFFYNYTSIFYITVFVISLSNFLSTFFHFWYNSFHQ